MPFTLSRSVLWKGGAVLTLAFVCVALAIGPLHVATGKYDGRNGTAEAMDDISAGLPLKLYEHQQNQIGPGHSTPGIYCRGSSQSAAFWKLKRVSIKEADFSEGHLMTTTEQHRVQSARAFAYLYNTTIYDMHQSLLQRLCPGIKLLPFRPGLSFGA